MSLMNEALRKKRRSDTQAEAPARGGRDMITLGKPARNRMIYAAVGCLLVVVGGYFVWQYLSIQDSFQTTVVSTPDPPRQQTPVKIRPSSDPVAGIAASRESNALPKKTATKPAKAPASSATEKQGYKQTQTRRPDHKIEPPVGAVKKKLTPATPSNQSRPRDSKVATPAVKPRKKPSVGKQPTPTPISRQENAGFPDRLAKLSPAEMHFYQKALSFHRKQDYHKAIEMYWKVLDKKPMHMDSRFNLASAYIQIAAYSEAKPILASLYKHNPKDANTVINLAIAEIGLGMAENALKLLNQAEDLESPPIFQIYYHRGVAYSKLGDYEASLLWYRKAERLNPKHANLVLNMAVAYDNLSRYREAVSFYELYLETAEASSKTETKGVSMRIRDLRRYLGWKSSVEDP